MEFSNSPTKLLTTRYSRQRMSCISCSNNLGWPRKCAVGSTLGVTQKWMMKEVKKPRMTRRNNTSWISWIRPHRFGGEGVLIGGQNSNTKCSMTFVNIAVAISALAGGGAQKRFRTETRIRWCFRHFSRIFGCLSARGYWNGILGHFGSFPAMEKRPKMKKTLYIARFCRVFGCQSIENTAKTSVLDWRYSKKRVNYRMFDWKHYKNTVKSNVLEGFTAFMAKNV